MGDETIDRIEELKREAAVLPYGNVKTSLLEEAVKNADTTRDVQLMFQTRMGLIDASSFSGHVDVSLAAFAWCLAHFQESPEQFQSHRYMLIWRMKNLLLFANQFPQISRQQFEGLCEQMTSLFKSSGYNLRSVHLVRLMFAVHTGDHDSAKQSFKEFTSVPRDAMAQCEACEADCVVEYYDFLDDPENSLKAAAPILAGQKRCQEVPHRTYAYVLRPLAMLGRYDEADEYHQKGYRMIRNNTALLVQLTLHIHYLVNRGQLAKASTLVERHLPWALNTCELRSRYFFYLAAERVFSSTAEKKAERKLKLTQEFPLYNASSVYQTDELFTWFQTERQSLGARFDARNGNDFLTGELVRQLQY